MAAHDNTPCSAWHCAAQQCGPNRSLEKVDGRGARGCSQILKAVASNQVLIVAGETGCGKTTQVPQYLLEDAHARGQHCRIVCSQPRRISATSVAERVAHERGDALGGSIGYAIRLKDVGGPRMPLRFVTCGILVKLLRSESAMEHVTHVVLDEMHERDRSAVFAVILLLQELRKRPHLRLIMMSATLQVRCTA